MISCWKPKGIFQNVPPFRSLSSWVERGKNLPLAFPNCFVLSLFNSHHNFVAVIDLPEGEHQYKFYVDGNWILDPKVVGKSFL